MAEKENPFPYSWKSKETSETDVGMCTEGDMSSMPSEEFTECLSCQSYFNGKYQVWTHLQCWLGQPHCLSTNGSPLDAYDQGLEQCSHFLDPARYGGEADAFIVRVE